MSELDFESRLGGQLRAYADGGVRPVDRYVLAEAIVAAGSRARPIVRLGRPRLVANPASRRTALIFVAAATVLALAGGALLLTAGHPPAPTPTPPPSSPTPGPASPKPGVSGSAGYEAIFMRATSVTTLDPDAYPNVVASEIDIVAMRTDGQERLVRHLSSSILPAGRSFRLGGHVSEDGWLAVTTFIGRPDDGFAYLLVDLAHPAREPLLVPAVLGGAWGPGGLFATGVSCCWRMKITNAETGATSTQINASRLPGGGPDIIWAADGSGLLVYQPNDGSHSTVYEIAPVAGGPSTPGVPQLVWSHGSRWVAAGGASLWLCESGSNNSPCDKKKNEEVLTQDVLGTVTEWYSGELSPATLRDASFSADGRSVWLLLDRMDGPRHVAVLARADAPGKARTVATVDLGPDVLGMRLSAFAPDDTIIAIGPSGWTANEPPVLVTTLDGSAQVHGAWLIGFVPGSLADAWPGGGTFGPVPDASTPSASDGTASPSGH